ncbi:flagellar motor protein MotB [Pararhodospirillum oryzae]|uniref:Motility protein B-like N-terminal domain-containing protein n=1 Tax=Pararhodospirillum oryzae TaxID=478448 RepID=A0A512H909_9PROT|nr:flagellar motor protein MotB [Pararhodospirillum oryzae]GEO81931.1 hypothetical protein ROR02_20620 [Pararhodospirillum oryzae]
MTLFDAPQADLGAVSAGSVPATGSNTGIWMVTFADLVLLLFAFFVMLFSMTTLEPVTLERFRLGVLSTRAEAPVAIETRPARVEANIATIAPPRAAATEYLAVVLRDGLARIPALEQVEILQAGDEILVRPPPALWSHGPLSDLALLLDRLDNRVMIVATVPATEIALSRAPARDGAAWQAALDRASAAADALRGAGFARALDVRIRPAPPTDGSMDLYVLVLGERKGS